MYREWDIRRNVKPYYVNVTSVYAMQHFHYFCPIAFCLFQLEPANYNKTLRPDIVQMRAISQNLRSNFLAYSLLRKRIALTFFTTWSLTSMSRHNYYSSCFPTTSSPAQPDSMDSPGSADVARISDEVARTCQVHMREDTYAADLASIQAARDRIKPYAIVTPVMTSKSIDQEAGRELYFKCEIFQKMWATKVELENLYMNHFCQKFNVCMLLVHNLESLLSIQHLHSSHK